MEFPSSLWRITRVTFAAENQNLLKRNAFGALRMWSWPWHVVCPHTHAWIGFVSIAGSRSLVTPIGWWAKNKGSPCLIWLFALSVLWKRNAFAFIQRKSMWGANNPQLDNGGATVRDSKFSFKTQVSAFWDAQASGLSSGLGPLPLCIIHPGFSYRTSASRLHYGCTLLPTKHHKTICFAVG